MVFFFFFFFSFSFHIGLFFFFLSHWLTLGLVWSGLVLFIFFFSFLFATLISVCSFFFPSFSPVFLCFSLRFSPVFLADQWRSSKYTDNPNLKKKKKPIEVKMKSRTKLNMHNIFQNKSRFLNHKKKEANSNLPRLLLPQVQLIATMPHRKLQAAHLRLRRLQPHFRSNTTNPSHHQTHQSMATVDIRVAREAECHHIGLARDGHRSLFTDLTHPHAGALLSALIF